MWFEKQEQSETQHECKQGDDDRLGQELIDHVTPSGSDCLADPYFARPPDCTCDGKIRIIQTCAQNNDEGHRSKDPDYSIAHRLTDLVTKIFAHHDFVQRLE